MAFEIIPSIADKLPTTVKYGLSKLSIEEQMMFQEQYQKKSKSTAIMLLLAIIFPIQLFLLNKVGLGIVFLLTGMGFFIWYIIEWFLTPKRVREYNEDIAIKILTDLKVIGK